MQDIQAAKDLVLACQEALEAAPADAAADTLARFTAPDYLWRGMHPFDRITGAEAVGSRFWDGLRGSLTHIQRRMDVFFAGANSLDGGASVWVVSMGHLMGLFDAPWLGIRPTGRLTMLRYCDFHRVEGGKIKETAAFFDIPHLMMQAGQNPFPPQTAAHLVQPGPRPHDGLLTGPQDPGAGDKTLAVINAMINDLGTWKSGLPLEEELAQTWHDDMLWWGPAGIGASYTIARYASIPRRFAQALPNAPGPATSPDWPKGITAASSAGPISPRSPRAASWACLPAPRRASFASSTSTGGAATSWRKTGSSSTCCITSRHRGWTCWRGTGPSRQRPVSVLS